MSDELKCPLCNEKMIHLASGDFTHYYNSCPMAHENFSRYKLVVIGQVVEAARSTALQEAAAACLTISNNPSSLWSEDGCWKHAAENCAAEIKKLDGAK